MKYFLNRVHIVGKSMNEYIELLSDKFKITKEIEEHYWADEDEGCVDKYYIELTTIDELEKLRGILYEYNKSNIIFENQGWDKYCVEYNEPTLIIYDDIIG